MSYIFRDVVQRLEKKIREKFKVVSLLLLHRGCTGLGLVYFYMYCIVKVEALTHIILVDLIRILMIHWQELLQ